MDPRDQRIVELEKEVADLKQQVAKLLAQLGRNSRNSHLPPSSDGPGARPSSTSASGPSLSAKDGKQEPADKRKRGGQPGHGGHQRQWLPPEQVDHVVDLYPEQCENCWADLPHSGGEVVGRYQVTEIPPVTPETTEYRRHAETCSCGYTTLAKIDAVPMSSFGPRLMSLVALLTGVYHLSRRHTVALLEDVLGVRISLGAVSTVEGRVAVALAVPTDEAWEKVKRAAVKHADATSWLQSGKLRSLWTLATKAATVFKIFANGSAEAIKPLFGTCKGILVSDRATVFSFWTMACRQICWAHLLRKFVWFSERDGPARQLGEELLGYTKLVFEYWRSRRAGTLEEATYQAWMAPVQTQVEACLARGAAAGIAEVSGSCEDILAHKEALWTFVARQDVEPTNNHAERELRAFVLWRKRSFGSQSDRGDDFAARTMTVAHTARKQGRNVLAFLTACCKAHLAKTEAPSLFADALLA